MKSNMKSASVSIIEQRTVTVVYVDEKVELTCSPQSFSDFNGWARSRFGLATTDKISFRNSSGSEIIPSQSYFCKEDYIEIVCSCKKPTKAPLEKTKSTGHILGPIAPKVAPVAPVASFADNSTTFFYYYGAPCLILLISMALTPQSGEYIDFFILKGSLSNKVRNTIVECYVNFLCWSSTYLFVRRLLNPETSPVVFKKFSADAFYGGLAAASTAFIKPILTAALQT